jgi:hypothetical protein
MWEKGEKAGENLNLTQRYLTAENGRRGSFDQMWSRDGKDIMDDDDADGGLRIADCGCELLMADGGWVMADGGWPVG